MASQAHGEHPTPLNNPFWSYALDLYARPGVAASCLTLQNKAHVDVCVLLYALYCAHLGHVLTPDELNAADARVIGWRQSVILPLRRIRQSIKSGVESVDPSMLEPVRHEIKQVELHAEQVLMALLYQLAPLAASTGRTTANLEAVVALYQPDFETTWQDKADVMMAMQTIQRQAHQ